MRLLISSDGKAKLSVFVGALHPPSFFDGFALLYLSSMVEESKIKVFLK